MMDCSVTQEASASHHDFKNLCMYLLDFKLHVPNFMVTRYVCQFKNGLKNNN